MGARCTQSPISALYGVPRAFMRNHVQVGPSDTQSEMVAVGQAWGGRGGPLREMSCVTGILPGDLENKIK